MLGRFYPAVLAVLLAFSMIAVACDDDDDNGNETPTSGASPSAEASPSPDESPTEEGNETPSGEGDEAAVEEAVRAAIDAYNSGDADGWWDSMTDDGAAGFLALFGIPTDDLEAAKEEASPFIGEDPLENPEITVTEASDDTATVELVAEAGGILEGDRLTMVMEEGEWKIDELALFAVSPEIEAGYTTVDVGLTDFAFELQQETIEAGPVAFALENTGEQPHEAVLARLDEGVDLGEALQSEGEPEGVEVLGGVFNVEPGGTYNLIFTEDLEPGRYAFVCFLPNLEEGPEGTPHAFLGMVQEFAVE